MNSTAPVTDSRVSSALAEIDQLAYPSLSVQPLDLGDLFGRLFDLGVVNHVRHGGSPVAQVTEWAARLIALSTPHLQNAVIEVADPRDIDGFPRGILFSITLTRGTRYIGENFVAVRNQSDTADIHLPGHGYDGCGTHAEWERMFIDLAQLLDRIEL